MAPRRACASKEERGVEKHAKVARNHRAAPDKHQLPERFPKGEVLTDVAKKQWKLGDSIGVGGFGEIYAASENGGSPLVPKDAPYVIKIEPFSNGPLYVEMYFYHRVAKAEMIEAWKAAKKLKHLGMPRFVASGSHEYRGNRYRFMVMERFGDDLQKTFEACGRKFPLKTVLTLGLKMVDVLEYIHGAGYVHADIKGSNLLRGFGRGRENDVFLVDFGLASRYRKVDDKHKEYEEDPRSAHNGTIEYTSRDAHVGATSRRGDLEILGYNMLQWLCGRLPWEDKLKDVEYVKRKKCECMADIPHFLKVSFREGPHPAVIENYLRYVARLEFVEDPDYDHLRKLLIAGLKKEGLANDGKLDFSKPPSPRKGVRKADVAEDDENYQSAPKQKRSTPRKPCGIAQFNRLQKISPKTRAGPSSACAPVDPAAIPTPAMLEVMRIRSEKEKFQRPVATARRGEARPGVRSAVDVTRRLSGKN